LSFGSLQLSSFVVVVVVVVDDVVTAVLVIDVVVVGSSFFCFFHIKVRLPYLQNSNVIYKKKRVFF
jgi:hypothetical protein